MPIALHNSQDKMQQAYRLIVELQNERQEVWSLYCHVAEFKPFSAKGEVKKILRRFSQMLIDYISLGHFAIYERVLAEDERRYLALLAAKAIYPELSATTEAAISFNDKYADAVEKIPFDDLEQDLSTLGENLAMRIDLEDRLCELMLHKY